jgi:hypothetical protein
MLRQLQSRMQVNEVTVALAAKIARIARVVLNRPGATHERWDPRFGRRQQPTREKPDTFMQLSSRHVQ